MKSLVKEGESGTNNKYPCLMCSNGVVVLFHSEGFGTVVSQNGLGQFGSYPMAGFVPFNGTVTLSND